LARVDVHAGDGSADGLLQVGVVKDDVGRFAAQFLGDALDGRGRVACDLDAGAGRAGERDEVDRRMRGERRADGPPIAVDEVEHARGDAGLVEDLGEDDGVEGAISDGLSTIVQPAANAGATLATIWFSAQFHG
jgi:hypothetical protein